MLSPEKIKSIRRQVISNQEKENELQSVYPQLEVSPDEGVARLNGKILDCRRRREEVARDVGLFLKYMDGYEKFHGDVAGMQRRYYEFANCFSAAPLWRECGTLRCGTIRTCSLTPCSAWSTGRAKLGRPVSWKPC